MDRIVKDEWVCIPNEKGEISEPFFVKGVAMVTSNYDEVQVNLKLTPNPLFMLSEKAVYTELSKPDYYNKLTDDMKILVPVKVSELGIKRLITK